MNNDTITNDSVEALYGATTAGYIKAFGLLAKRANNPPPVKNPRYTYVDGGSELHIHPIKGGTDAEKRALRTFIRAIRRERDINKQREMVDQLDRTKLLSVPIKRAVQSDRSNKGDATVEYRLKARANGSGKGVRQLALRQVARMERAVAAGLISFQQAAE